MHPLFTVLLALVAFCILVAITFFILRLGIVLLLFVAAAAFCIGLVWLLVYGLMRFALLIGGKKGNEYAGT